MVFCLEKRSTQKEKVLELIVVVIIVTIIIMASSSSSSECHLLHV